MDRVVVTNLCGTAVSSNATLAITPSSGLSALLIWDVIDPNTLALSNALVKACIDVTLSAANETAYNGANPSPFGFGAVIHLNGTTIQVRKPWKNTVLFSSIIDEQGRFDIGLVPAGKYRLVIFWIKDKKVSRLPLFDQPKPMVCSSENECKLKIELELHSTDQQFEYCPPK